MGEISLSEFMGIEESTSKERVGEPVSHGVEDGSPVIPSQRSEPATSKDGERAKQQNISFASSVTYANVLKRNSKGERENKEKLVKGTNKKQ